MESTDFAETVGLCVLWQFLFAQLSRLGAFFLVWLCNVTCRWLQPFKNPSAGPLIRRSIFLQTFRGEIGVFQQPITSRNKGGLEQSLVKHAVAKHMHINNKNLIYFTWYAQLDKTVNVHTAVSIVCDSNLFTYRKASRAGCNYLYSATNLFKFVLNNIHKVLMFLVLPCRTV